MSSLKTVAAGHLTLLIEDGRINAPFSIYLSEEFDNPHTREAVARALRLFHRFLEVFGVDLAARALEGECLKSVECKWLGELVYRPLEELELMSDKAIKRLVTTNREGRVADINGAVQPNTAAKRLTSMASFLAWYRRALLNEAIRSSATRQQLEHRYAEVCAQLCSWIAGTKQGHHHEIRSLPVERFLELVRALFLHPNALFVGNCGARSSTVLRDRAIALLAAEGLRPGSLGNLAIDDFRYRPGDTKGYVILKDNTGRRKSPVTTATPTVKGIRSISQNYKSAITVKLWPFTCIAISEYIDGERAIALSHQLANRSQSFLFLKENGVPFKDRSSITNIFSRLAASLKSNGMLNITKGDPYSTGSYYDFSAYTLRHSAATLFYSEKKQQSDVKDQMRLRFGWSAKSTQPDRYANRAMSEAASTDMNEFHQSLLRELASRKLLLQDISTTIQNA